jgi:ribonuclease E
VRSYFSAPVSEAAVVESAVHAMQAVVAETAPPAVEPIVIEPVAAPVAIAAPVETGTAAMPVVQPYELAVEALAAIVREVGLEWVQSDADKVAQVQAAIAAEPRPVHVPREPKPVVLLDEGPLILVETRRDLGTMKLPFEA